MNFYSNVSSIDPLTPSVFELISSDQLSDLIQPALKYVLAFYASRYPRYLLRLNNNRHELYAAVTLLVESHFLKKYGASFTENFYGLIRERALPVRRLDRTQQARGPFEELVKLRTRDYAATLLLLVGIPYLKAKADELHEAQIGTDQVFGNNTRRQHPVLLDNSTRLEILRFYLLKMFKKLYPSLHAAYYISTLSLTLSYLFATSPYHTLGNAVIGQRLRRLTEADSERLRLAYGASTSSQSLVEMWNGKSSLSPLAFMRLVLPKVVDTLKYALPFAIFSLKFGEWYGESEISKQIAKSATSSIEMPPPAHYEIDDHQESEQDVSRHTTSKRCTICAKDMVNPTAIQTGYVFCYVCAFKWIEEFDSCPVTHVKVLGGTNGLRRLMV